MPLHQHLLLSLRVKEAPTVTLNNKKALVSLLANIHVLFYVPQGTPESLFELNSVSGQGVGGGLALGFRMGLTVSRTVEVPPPISGWEPHIAQHRKPPNNHCHHLG